MVKRRPISGRKRNARKRSSDPTVPLEAVFAAFGKALLHGHHLERQVALFVACWDALKNTQDDASFVRLLDELQRKTFGQIIDAGVRNGAISEAMLVALRPAKELRNALVHRTADWLPLTIATKLGPLDAFGSLCDIGDQFYRLAAEFSERAIFCSELRGISAALVHKTSLKVLKRARTLDRLGNYATRGGTIRASASQPEPRP